MHVWNVLHAARWKYRTQKNRHLGTITQICRAISSQLWHVPTIGRNLLNINTSSTCPHNMVNCGPITFENCWRVWGTPANFKGFRVLAALLHGTSAVGVSQTLRRWTEGTTYIRQGGHHVGHWPTFLVQSHSTLTWFCICTDSYVVFNTQPCTVLADNSIFSERELHVRYLLSPVRLSSVCNVRAPFSGGSYFRQYFYGIRYLGHSLTSTENFTEIVPGEPLRRGS